MATQQELENNRQTLLDQIDAYGQQLIRTANPQEKKRLTDLIEAARDSIDTIDSEIGKIKKSKRVEAQTARQKAATEQVITAKLANTQKALDDAQVAYLADPRNQTRINLFQTALANQREAEQAAIRQGLQITPTVSEQNGTFVVASAATTPAAGVARPLRPTEQGIPKPAGTEVAKDKTETTPTGTTPTGAKAPTAPVAGGKSDFNTWAEAQSELRGLTDTPENRKMLRAEYRKQGAFTGDWETEFRRRFPADQYILDLDPEVKAIAQRAINEDWFLYPEAAKSLISRLIANTQYGLKTNSTQRTFDARPIADQMDLIDDKISKLKGTYGQLGLDDNEWFNIAKTSVRNGNNDDQNKSLIYSTVYRRDPRTGELAFQAAVAQVEQSKLAQDVNGVFTNEYLLAKPEGDYIESYARGELTLEDVRRQARVLAKQQFPGLSSFIDQGLSVKTIADQYKSQAASILEMPSSTIDMNDPKFRVALDARGDGESRPLSFGEWETLLKTNPNYGWQYTKTANKQALDIATTIARAFGKVV